MSEYQYYEFLALDRPLSSRQIAEVRQFSTRAEISSTRFVNEYHWGDFRGDPFLLLQEYFDVMVYVANWGTHRLMFGLPSESISRTWRGLTSDNGMEIRKAGCRCIIDLWSEEELEFDVEEGEGWMASLSSLRAELLAGDERPLHLAWLACVSSGADDDKHPFPIPSGLKQLTPAQKTLAEFLRVDEDLLRAAAKQSPSVRAPSKTIAKWIATLPPDEKDRMLAELLAGDDPHGAAKILRKFREHKPEPHARRQRKSRT